MHIWTINNWEKYLNNSASRRSGLYFRYEPSVHSDVKNACTNFAKWLRSEYYFPVRIIVYIKGKERINTMDGDLAVGTFFEPYDFSVEPYAKIAAGDYPEMLISFGRDNALATILTSIAHELTHYYQWINNLKLTELGRERQAKRYSHFVVDEYALTREHP